MTTQSTGTTGTSKGVSRAAFSDSGSYVYKDDGMSQGAMSHFAATILRNKEYTHSKGGGNYESWPEAAERVVRSVMGPYLPDLVERTLKLVVERKFVPGGRYLYASGRKSPMVNNCFLFRCVEDSRQEWGRIADKSINALMCGGGVGVVYSGLREEDAVIGGLGGRSTGPCALMRMVNENGRYIRQGGSRRSAIWAGLHWNHKDIFKFIALKDWPDSVRRMREEDFNFPAPMDGTNVSVILDDDFFAAYGDEAHPLHDLAANVYWTAVRHMLRTGEPGFSVDIGENRGENLRNACTEVTSSDDGDMCNLGSVNMGRMRTPEEFAEAVECGTAFLLCGTIYSKLPLQEMYKVREKNRRIGLGLMGVHEWMLRRGHRYGPNDELARWMQVYADSGAFAYRFADKLGISRPVATRSIAPTGTISIIAETTSGIEPIYAVAYKRRYLEGIQWKAQYVVDAAARRLIDAGVDPNLIEDSYTLAEDVERRVGFQAWLQERVDHGISSTINLPPWGSSINNEATVTQFGRRLLTHLPRLRGITAYPDGARGGQPLNRVTYTEAVKHVGRDFVEETEHGNEQSCKSGVCGE
jgi:ribonucleoside-diphosphate reductase alpha chain